VLLEGDVLLETVERMDAGFFVADPDDDLGLLYANPWLEARVGRDREALCRSEGLLDIVPASDHGALARAVLEALRGDAGKAKAEMGILGADGAVTPVAVSLTSVERASGRYLLGTLNDLSAAKGAEVKAEQARERTEFYVGMAMVDLFNLLEGALLNLDLASMSADDPDGVKSRISRAVGFMRSSVKLIAAIRNASVKPEGSDMEVPIDVCRTVREQVELLTAIYSSRELRFSLDLPKGPAPTWGGKRAEEAIFNLLIWAARTGRPEALRAVTLQDPVTQGGSMRLTVCAIAHPWREEVDPAPDPRPQAEARAHAVSELALACQILDELGGRIWLDDQADGEKGLSWRCGVELPVARPRLRAP
jgi:hypothetical protein